jgi:hypothetical protein
MNTPNRRWQAIGGYCLDLWRIARGDFENPHSYLKFLRIDKLRSKLGADAFVETGTYLGVTAHRASFRFSSVYTVELGEQLAARARVFLSRRPNVRVIQGDALSAIPQIFGAEAFQRAIVFLDAHYSGPGTAAGAQPEPALHELNMLRNYQSRIAAIVIDDFRSFGEEPGFPKKSDLLETAERLFPDYRVTVGFDQLVIFKQSHRPLST